MPDQHYATLSWNKLGLGVQFTWSSVAYEVIEWLDESADAFVADVCRVRRMGKKGKLFGPVRRFTFENCVIETPVILKGKSDG